MFFVLFSDFAAYFRNFPRTAGNKRADLLSSKDSESPDGPLATNETISLAT